MMLSLKGAADCARDAVARIKVYQRSADDQVKKSRIDKVRIRQGAPPKQRKPTNATGLAVAGDSSNEQRSTPYPMDIQNAHAASTPALLRGWTSELCCSIGFDVKQSHVQFTDLSSFWRTMLGFARGVLRGGPLGSKFLTSASVHTQNPDSPLKVESLVHTRRLLCAFPADVDLRDKDCSRVCGSDETLAWLWLSEAAEVLDPLGPELSQLPLRMCKSAALGPFPFGIFGATTAKPRLQRDAAVALNCDTQVKGRYIALPRNACVLIRTAGAEDALGFVQVLGSAILVSFDIAEATAWSTKIHAFKSCGLGPINRDSRRRKRDASKRDAECGRPRTDSDALLKAGAGSDSDSDSDALAAKVMRGRN